MSTLHLIVHHFAKVSLDEEARLFALLTEADVDGIARHPESRKRQQLARAWRREILAQALGVAPEILIFDQEAHGKPFLASHKISFNISHSQEAFALIWSAAEIPLGIDIEDKRRKRQEQTLAARTFCPDELQAWQNSALTPIQTHEQWLTTWTRKEAVLKAHGLGIRLDLNTLNTENADNTLKHSMLGEWKYQSFNLADQMVSVAWNGEAQEIIVEQNYATTVAIKKPS